MEEWYEELDFEENPFSTNPSDFVKNLVGRDDVVDELIYRVSSGSLVFLEGPQGSGKTSLLRSVIKRFRGRGKVIYVNSEKFEKKLNVEDLLTQRNGLIKGLLLKKKPKKMILLLDNVSELSYRNMERIKNYYDENFLHSVIFTGENFSKVGFSDSLKQRLEGRVIKIPSMTTDQIVEMVRLRLGDSKFFSDEIVASIAKICSNNPKSVLTSCEEVAEFVVGTDDDVVNEKHVKEVLGSNDDSKSKTKRKDAPEIPVKEDIVKDEKPTEDETDEANDDSEETLYSDELKDQDSTEDDKPDVEGKSKDEDSEVSEDSKEVEEQKEKVDVIEDSDDDLDDFFEDDEDSSNEDVVEKPAKSASKKSEKEAKVVDDEDSDDDLDDFFEDDEDSDNVEKKEEKESEVSKEKSDDDGEAVIKPIIADDDDEDDSERKDKKVLSEDDDLFEDEFFADEDDDEDYNEEDDSNHKKSVETDDSIFDDFFDDDMEEEK